MYHNIVSPNIVSYARYAIIGSYPTLELALRHYERDIAAWKEKHRNTRWYKLNYPFAYATVKIGAAR